MVRRKKIAARTWKEFLTRVRNGETVTAICRSLNIDRSSPYRKRERDGEFAEEWDFAERDSVELLNDFVLKSVAQPEVTEKYDSGGNLVERIVKPPNMYNVIRVLERRHPHWKPASDISGDSSETRIASASIVDGKLRIGYGAADGS